MAPQYREEDANLIDALYTLSAKSPKLVKSSEYAAPADPGVRVRSWKMDEFKYYVVPAPFPTLARGLFTTPIAEGAGGGAAPHRRARVRQVLQHRRGAVDECMCCA